MVQVRVNRRGLIIAAGVVTLLGGACAAPAAAPTAERAGGAQPTAPPTESVGRTAPPPAPTKPPAPTTAPAKRTFTRVTVPFSGAVAPAANTAWSIGREMGFFDQFGIDLSIKYLRGTQVLIPSLLNQEGWLGWLTTAGTTTAIEKGAALRILGGGYTVPAYALFARSGARSINDLAGKTLGADQPGSLSYDLTQLMLKNAGMTDKVQIAVAGPTTEVWLALVAGKIDAGISNAMFMDRAPKEGLVVLQKLWEQFPKYATTVFVASTAALGQHRDEITRTLAGLAKTLRYVQTDAASKQIWIKIAESEFKIDPEAAAFDWQWYRENKGFAQDLAITKDQIDFMQQLNVESGNQSKLLPIEQILEPGPLKDALALVGS